ncbi:Distal tail protein Dit [Enterococcus phage dArtagnan]|uniref:Distal tail protein Dit n=2 Tax=Aramisvirus TaxID=3152613 RepID=A0A8D6UFE7_9CAUD|nr:Distal tail protein Dit [Enterococcus phage Aramis]CAD7767762.1 Distal tail protein Dit [Enterococcus phage dArtagnan]
MEYAFLKNFSFDGKETSHLFQIAKVTIPFLSKENELLQVGNSNGSTFLNTRRTTNTIQIDGFMIKDNSGMNIYDTKDELVRILNTNEPKHLIFNMFPNRYFNAIYSGMQEYDATDSKYTPLTLTFDVPDGLAHNINPSSYTNVYATNKNLVLDSEYNHIGKYLKPWVQKLDEKFNNSNVVQADFTNGIPLNFESDKNSDERWINWSPATTIHNNKLKVGDEVNFSVYAQVVSLDEENKKEYAGQVILEEWDTVKSAILKRHVVDIPKKVTTGFIEYGSVVKIENENTNAINLQYGFIGNNIIKWSKPMVSFLPPIGETVTAPSVGAKAYSNSVDFGDYDYSGNPNLMANINADSFSQGSGALSVVDDGDEVVVTLDPNHKLELFKAKSQPALLTGKTYTVSVEIMLEGDFTGDPSKIGLRYIKMPNWVSELYTRNTLTATKGVWQKLTGTVKITAASDNAESWLIMLQNKDANNSLSGKLRLRHAKVEEGSTATPFQPNLLNAPYYLSKVVLGENLITNAQFPINTSNNPISGFDISEELIIGETYTVSLKGTKPATKEFHLYYGEANYQQSQSQYQATLRPVEGLTDVWSATFTARKTSEMTNLLKVALWQKPNSATYDNVQIDWLKIEKGDTRTPDIPYYKYEGIAPAPSNNPKDYHWGYSPSYINAVEYVPSDAGYSDIIEVYNNGTAETYPQFTFTMNGENGLVGLLHEDGSILQFGNPENVDGKDTTKSLELGVNQSFWGNTLNPEIAVNTGFKSVWNPTPPNEVRGSWDMTTNVNSVTPHYAGVGDIGVWHGPTMMLDIKPPYNNDRNNEVEARMAFMFDNDVKYRRGRYEFSVFDENGNPIMTTILSDANAVSNTIQFELWYKGSKLGEVSLNKSRFSGREYEIVMLRRGKKLQWNFIKVHTTKRAKYEGTTYAQVIADTVESFNWTLEENDSTNWMRVGVWAQRYSNQPVAIQVIRHIQVRWLNTSYYQDIRNYFQDGDIVEIDVASRSLFVNGVINNELNVVGNQWESFILPVGKTVIQPVLSTWANNPDVVCVVRDSWN